MEGTSLEYEYETARSYYYFNRKTGYVVNGQGVYLFDIPKNSSVKIFEKFVDVYECGIKEMGG